MNLPFTLSLRRWRQPMLVAALATMLGTPVAARQSAFPPAIQALQKQGAQVVGSFDSASGLKAYVAIVGDQQLPLYVTPDGQHVIAGMALDDAGENADEAALGRVTSIPLAADTWKKLESSHWIADGRAQAPRIVYVFTDPNTPTFKTLLTGSRTACTNRSPMCSLLPTRAEASLVGGPKHSGEPAWYESARVPSRPVGLSQAGKAACSARCR